MILDMESNAAVVLEEALELVRNNDGLLAAVEALRMASEGHSDAARADARKLFEEAAVRPETGLGIAFQVSILERALRKAQRGLNAQTQTPANAGKERKVMSDNTSNTNAPAAPKATKKYNTGETFNTVATMGLKPTDAGRKATCGFQFSRKTGKEGVMDLPAGTPVLYVGAKAVYDGQANSKRMLFKVNAGTRVILDGQDTMLDNDILIAGVVNHIDEDDPYNIQSRENEQKRAQKAALKQAAANAKTKAA